LAIAQRLLGNCQFETEGWGKWFSDCCEDLFNNSLTETEVTKAKIAVKFLCDLMYFRRLGLGWRAAYKLAQKVI